MHAEGASRGHLRFNRHVALTYGEYLKVPELLSLQELLSDPPHHDETLFIVVHQAYELWFKQVLHELDSARAHLESDRVVEATRLLRRVAEIQRLLISQVRILETMRPQDFLGFRYHLNPASGFQSVQFREVEFALGLKDPAILGRIVCSPPEMGRLRGRLAATSTSDAVDALLLRRGFARHPEPAPAPHRRSQPEEWRLRAFVRIYEDPEGHADLNALCEVLIEIDELLALWRANHVHMVERMIGHKPGTGGSEGVAYLQTTLPKRAFPDLWGVRTHLAGEPE
jgi:tryptophan 2,3-dioxygenase